MKTKVMKLADIIPADYNPRVTLKKGDSEYEALDGSIGRFGLVVPLIVNERSGVLVSGHQRLNALLEDGETEAEVVLVDVDEQDEKILNVSLNKIDGEWDYAKLKELIESFEPEDIKFTGFSEAELNSLFGDVLPQFGGEDDEEEESKDAKRGNEEDSTETPEQPAALHEFNIFLSFPSKELAEKWMEERGIDLKYTGTNRNITIRMEGLDYGDQRN